MYMWASFVQVPMEAQESDVLELEVQADVDVWDLTHVLWKSNTSSLPTEPSLLPPIYLTLNVVSSLSGLG